MSAPFIPEQQTAIIAGPAGEFLVSDTVKVPTLMPDQILVKTGAVALNPVDTKLIGDFVTPGVMFGFDCAGTIVALGSEVPTDEFKIGDRVCGSASGMNQLKPLGGSFAEYAKLQANMSLHVPDYMSIEDAASLGTSIASAAMCLFWSLKWPGDLLEGAKHGDEAKPPVLVYGGSTSTGTMVLQLLKLCGFPTIATCSPHNFDFVKGYGADVVYDYKSSDCAAKIRADTNNELEYIIDCFAEDSSMRFCYAAMGRAGGKYVALNPFSEHLHNRKVIEPDWILATRIAGDGSMWPAPFACPDEPKILEISLPLYRTFQVLLDERKIRPHTVQLEDGGLSGIPEGVQKIRSGAVSGVKLVYPIAA
ncbi:alcohol dehydrogenase [Penicillium verhagenii]|uniref:alcohol dehydrogenase n=1 Tax=Penicillium verhagenii TaxID=1562060 RepID=UPI0025459493|nr:alcohol dehydrogenase [Penicillium verhagenii]KAJ5948191.1 alcohol dehydrogenase [Penicillium verhagenii]